MNSDDTPEGDRGKKTEAQKEEIEHLYRGRVGEKGPREASYFAINAACSPGHRWQRHSVSSLLEGSLTAIDRLLAGGRDVRRVHCAFRYRYADYLDSVGGSPGYVRPLGPVPCWPVDRHEWFG